MTEGSVGELPKTFFHEFCLIDHFIGVSSSQKELVIVDGLVVVFGYVVEKCKSQVGFGEIFRMQLYSFLHICNGGLIILEIKVSIGTIEIGFRVCGVNLNGLSVVRNRQIVFFQIVISDAAIVISFRRVGIDADRLSQIFYSKREISERTVNTTANLVCFCFFGMNMQSFCQIRNGRVVIF